MTVLFPGVVDRARAGAALDTLVVRSGWQATNPDWITTPKSGRLPAQTIAGFYVGTLYPNGVFPVEAFALAFRAWRDLYVTFVHGGSFQYTGSPHFEDANARLDVVPGKNALTLHYIIKNPNLQSFALIPPLSPQATVPQPARRRGLPLAGWALIAILGAALAWVLVYLVMGGHKAPRANRAAPHKKHLRR